MVLLKFIFYYTLFRNLVYRQ